MGLPAKVLLVLIQTVVALVLALVLATDHLYMEWAPSRRVGAASKGPLGN
jgi:hypothetical protein